MSGLKNVRNRRDDSLSRVTWDQLETLLAIHYRGQGYRVEHCGTGATRQRFDGGVDLKLHKDDQYIVVHQKRCQGLFQGTISDARLRNGLEKGAGPFDAS